MATPFSQSRSGDSSLARVKSTVKTKKKPKSREAKLTLLSQPSIEQVSTAIAMLRNNSEEFKSLTTGELKITDLDTALVKGVRSMFNPNKVYRFRLAFTGITSSDGAGKIDTTVNFQISTAEWGYLQILFDEVKLLQATLTIAPLLPGVPATPATPANRCTLLLCSLPATQNGYSTAALASNKSDAVLVAPLAVKPVKLTYHCTDRPWASSADPAGTTTPTPTPTGTMGCFGLNAIGEALTFSTPYFHFMMNNIIMLRIRA